MYFVLGFQIADKFAALSLPFLLNGSPKRAIHPCTVVVKLRMRYAPAALYFSNCCTSHSDEESGFQFCLETGQSTSLVASPVVNNNGISIYSARLISTNFECKAHVPVGSGSSFVVASMTMTTACVGAKCMRVGFVRWAIYASRVLAIFY